MQNFGDYPIVLVLFVQTVDFDDHVREATIDRPIYLFWHNYLSEPRFPPRAGRRTIIRFQTDSQND
jgi:hypothetical protein